MKSSRNRVVLRIVKVLSAGEWPVLYRGPPPGASKSLRASVHKARQAFLEDNRNYSGAPFSDGVYIYYWSEQVGNRAYRAPLGDPGVLEQTLLNQGQLPDFISGFAAGYQDVILLGSDRRQGQLDIGCTGRMS